MSAAREALFWAKVHKTPTCWIWTAALLSNGYGQFSIGGRKRVGAHRFSYEIANGPISKGSVIDHLCRNRACVNPDHLEAVSNRTNILRGVGFAAVNAKKEACDRGHEFTTDNTYISKEGWRECRYCKRDNMRRYRNEELTV